MRKVFLLIAAAGLGIASLAGGCSSKNKGFSDFQNAAKPDASEGEEEPSPEPEFPGDDGGFQVTDAPSDTRYDFDSGCATARAQGKQLPVYLHLVIDGSGSMSSDGKWTATVDALNDWLNRLAANTVPAPDGGTRPDPSLGVGLYIFESSVREPANQWDRSINAVSTDHAQWLKARLNGTQPSGGTPLLEAVQGQLPLLRNVILPDTLEPNGKKVMVVMTDGVPNGGVSDQTLLIQIAGQELANHQITTFVVGIGDPNGSSYSYDPTFLSRWANAGGAAPAGCDPNWNKNSAGKPCHFQINSGSGIPAPTVTAQLMAAIDEVRGAAKGCEFILDKSGGAIDPNKVNVIYTDENGVEHLVTKDPVNGWKYDDDNNPSKVILVGQACSKYKQKAKAKVEIILGCKTAVN